MARLLSLVLCFAVSWWGGPAFAGSASIETTLDSRPWLDDRSSAHTPTLASDGELLEQSTGDSAAASGDVDARIAELEAQRDAIDTRRPRFWTITGSVMTGVGLVIGLTAIIGCLGSSEAGAGCSPEHWAGLGASAGLLTIGGVATLIPNAKKLREKNRERKTIEEEIRDLQTRREQAASLSGFRIGFDPKSKALTLGWVY